MYVKLELSSVANYDETLKKGLFLS